MSIKLMTEAWKINIPSSAKLVLLSLCDNANDQGECYPSISHVSERCSMSERGVRYAISNLIKKGIISKQDRKGRSNMFFIADPCNLCTRQGYEYAP